MKRPLCVAPWTNILIDTNKGVKPCCAYMDTHIGNIEQTDVFEIINSPSWAEVKRKLINREWPKGCEIGCKQQEDKTGWSPRLGFQMHRFQNEINGAIDYETDEILYMEFNGSNVCNLACLHCNPIFSSKWQVEWKKLKLDDIEYKNTISNVELIEKNLKQLNLSKLKYIHFKGGEPLLNDETLCVLEHLNSLDILKNVRVTVFTNGSIYNERLIELFGKAKEFVCSVSIDGPDKLFDYIRYGDSSIKKIENFISVVNKLDNSMLAISVSTMVYNVFKLVEIRDLWLDWKSKYKFRDPFFNIVVTHPNYLNVCVLSDDTRKYLTEHLKKHQCTTEFSVVLKALANDYLGDEVHNQWVDYTKNIEALRGNNILELVPELTNELVYR